MVKKISVIFFSSILYVINIHAQEHVSITDYGANPNDGKNVVIAIRNALKVCAVKDSSVLVFPKGRYDFWPDFTSNQATIGIQIDKLKKVTIDGGGSEFVFHGKMQIANLVGCVNVTLRNFSVDWDHPFIAQGQYVTTTDEYIELKIDPEVYVIENNQFYLIGEGWKSRPTGYFTLYDKDKKEILYKTNDGINKALFLGKAEEISPGLVRFYGKPTLKPEPGTFQEIYAGTYIITGMQISECKDTYLKNITIYHALSNGVNGVRSENITMDNVSMTVNEKKGRVFSIVADASHFTNCKGLIKVINCKHTGQGDDFINVHGTNTPIATINDEYSVTTGKPASNIRAGDEIWFVNQKTSQRGEVRVVKSTERTGSGNGRGSGSKISFTHPVPKTIQAGDFIENKTWNPRVEIQNCEILKKHRARGILITTPEKVIIENNYFRTAGTAILIEGDTDFWFESGANNDVTIRNNVFEDCLTSGCSTGKRGEWGEAIITITPSHHPENENTEPYHKNIKIENNTFKTFDVPLVHARSVRGLTFNNNEIILTHTYVPYTWQKSSFLLDGCRDVIISGNHISEDYSIRLIETEHMKKTDVKSDKNQKFNIRAIDNTAKPDYVDDFKRGK
jgi:hypothetical protein